VYWERNAWHDLHGDDLNEALRGLSGPDITAKDFRTWHARSWPPSRSPSPPRAPVPPRRPAGAKWPGPCAR
jgi:hypothetical protein